MRWLPRRRNHSKKTDVGRAAERLARELLESRGLHAIAENYRCPWGEIDLIMRDDAFVVFVEVRYRRGSAWGSPLETVDARKQARIVRSALHFLSRHPALAHNAQRFDVISVAPGKDGGAALDWIKNAFQSLDESERR
jgi:putative endonuclease